MSNRDGITWISEDRGFETPCWIWQKPNEKGYGPYRAYYVDVFGSRPRGNRLHLHHMCEVRSCVNPTHLAVVDAGEHRRLHIDSAYEKGYADGYAAGLRASGVEMGGDYETVKEVARRLGTTTSYVRRLCRQGRLAATQRGHDWVVEKGALPLSVSNI